MAEEPLCHRGLTTAENCGKCQRDAEAASAISKIARIQAELAKEEAEREAQPPDTIEEIGRDSALLDRIIEIVIEP